MENIKKLLEGYEAPYDHKDWIKLEKDLPKSPGLSGLTKTILVATALIIAVGSVILLNNLINNKEDNQITSDKTVVAEDNRKVNDIIVTDNSDTKEHYVNNNVQNVITSNNNTENLDEKTNNQTNQDNIQTTQDPIEKTENITENIIKPDDLIQNKVNPSIPSLEKAIFSVEIIENCIPAKVIFRAINIPENCDVIWNTDENVRVYGNTAYHTYLDAGIYEPEVSINYNNQTIKTEKLRKITINKSNDVKINFENSENLYYFTCNNKEELRLLWSIDNQQFSEKEISFEFERGGEYLVKLVAVNDFGCKSETSEKINIVIEHVYFVPNAFTPNSDGVNSSFGPIGENMDFTSYKLIIVDGNGTAVFESDSPEFMWNGKINNIGAEAKPGFYLWEIKTLDKYGNLQTKKGRVNLIRN